MTDMNAQAAAPPPGWYQDPSGSGYRWWDGARWTEHVHPGTEASTAAAEPESRASTAAAEPEGPTSSAAVVPESPTSAAAPEPEPQASSPAAAPQPQEPAAAELGARTSVPPPRPRSQTAAAPSSRVVVAKQAAPAKRSKGEGDSALSSLINDHPIPVFLVLAAILVAALVVGGVL